MRPTEATAHVFGHLRWRAALPRGKGGRKRTAQEIERLILRLAAETGWGYTRILGELRKLNIRSISRKTVKHILQRNGYDTGPKRGLGSWDE